MISQFFLGDFVDYIIYLFIVKKKKGNLSIYCKKKEGKCWIFQKHKNKTWHGRT